MKRQHALPLAQKRLTDLAELAADEWAANHSDNARSVAQALFTCATKITDKPQPNWGLAMARDKSKLRTRIDRLLDANKTHFKTTANWAKCAAGAGFIAGAMAIPALALGDLPSSNDASSDKSGISTSIRSEGEGNENEGSFVRKDNGHEIHASWQGLFALTADESTLTSLTPGGSFNISEKGKGPTRSIEFSNSHNLLTHTFSIDGATRAMDDSDQQWLAQALLTFLRSSGEWANERVTRIYNNGGVAAVLTEMSQIKGRGLQLYSHALLNLAKLNDDETRQLLVILENLKGDYALRVVYSALLTQSQLQQNVLNDILIGAKRISSDYEMRVLLESVLNKGLEQRQLDDGLFATLLTLSETIDSDYEMRVLLSSALDQKGLSDQSQTRLMAIAKAQISSDYELRVLIVKFTIRNADSAVAIQSAIDALGSVQSDYEQRVAITNIARDAKLDNNGWLSLISSVSDISSDKEASDTLLVLLNNMPEEPNLRQALSQAADDGISSKQELSRVKEAL